jgi:hypothetical protein
MHEDGFGALSGALCRNNTSAPRQDGQEVDDFVTFRIILVYQ